MNMAFVDWAIVFGLLVFIVTMAIITNRYTQSVADFLAANRCAGRYLLCISSGIAGLGAISVVAKFEAYYEAGFTATWWELMIMPLMIILALTGWVVYRYRETRAMTLAQFLEMRYGRSFRVFAGIILWVSGVVNFGIFPAVGSRFFIYFCGLPETVPILGISMFAFVMLILLGISLFFVFIGGQIAVMITDFFQGMFTNIVFLIIMVVLFWIFDWDGIVETLKEAPRDASRLHPFHTSEVKGFNVWYFIIQVITVVYGYRAWQGSQAYNCSAKSAHEARMAGILGEWRALVLFLVITLLPIGAYVVMHSPKTADVAAEATAVLEMVENPTIRTQMTVPVVLAKVLPTGVVGLLCAVMLAAFVSTHDTYLHSWGSIFVQDVILPFRKKSFTPRQHLLLLRLSILFVAIFIFCWSMLVPQTEYILMFFALTGAIWLGGAGSVIIGGLYWRRGSAKGAWAALITGAVIGVGSLVVKQFWPGSVYPWLAAHTPGLLAGFKNVVEGIAANVYGINWEVGPEKFPFDGQWVNFFAICSSIAAYAGFSLLDWLVLKKRPYNLEKMLHRGKYRVAADHEDETYIEPVSGWRALLTNEEFTRADKFVYWGNVTWSVGWLTVFIIGTLISLALLARGQDISVDSWANFWAVKIILTLIVGTITTIWFFIGGIRDVRDLFKTLATIKRDHTDDGRVTERYDLDDEAVSADIAGGGGGGDGTI